MSGSGARDPAGFAVRVEETRGRRYPEWPHPYRNDYERDRDRIIHSRAFRRLEDKTQVFSRRYSDHFRTRLTHTLEVAQISRTVARVLRLNTDLTEALALAHDIGHPPFGHAGEATLDRLMRAFGDRFDHNLHALRIVETFEQKSPDFPGLNLTFEVREGIIKHSKDYSAEEFPELREYLLQRFPPLEGQLIDWADEIAYNCADLDDGYEARLLTVNQMRRGVPFFDRCWRAAACDHRAAPEKLQFNATLRRLLDVLVTDLIHHTEARVRQAGIRSVEGVRRARTRLASLSGRMGRENQRLKRFLHRNLYSHAALRADRETFTLAVEELFGFFLEHPRSLPKFYFEQTRREPVHRVVCDYIAGMTDHFLLDQHRRHLRP